MADEERALEPDVHGGVPGRFRQRLQFARHDLHGVVDHDVDAAALLDDGVDQARDVGGLRHVGDHRKRLAAERDGVFGGGIARSRVDVIDDDMGALAGKSERDVAADAAAAAGDEGNLVFQAHKNIPFKTMEKKTLIWDGQAEFGVRLPVTER